MKIKNYKKRIKFLRRRLLDISQMHGAIHLGGALSSVEIIDAIYSKLINKNNNDIFIMSKGHSAILQYIYLEYLGVLKKNFVNSYCKKNSLLGVHPDIEVPGIHASTGSLGHGLAILNGIALANRKKRNKYFLLMSDGELQEGSVWEAARISSDLKLNNIIVFVDCNNIQSSDYVSKLHPNTYPIDKKFRSFGWQVEKCNGHNRLDLLKAFKKRKKNKPYLIIANTIKGFPLSFAKDNPLWHYRSPSKDEYKIALKEI